MEVEWDQQKLEKRLRQYFKNAAKNLEFYAKSWQELIEEYADAVFASLFQALKDRGWLTQVDFLMVVDAAVKELFPRDLLAHVPQHIFERQVLQAHDRAFEEQRFAPMLWDVLFEKLPDKSTKNRVYNAFEAGRKEAAIVSTGDGDSPVEEFIHAWVGCSLTLLQEESPGIPLEKLLPKALCTEVLHCLLEAGALPLPLTSEHGVPPEAGPQIDIVVEEAYMGTLQVKRPPRRRPVQKGGEEKGAPKGGGKYNQAWSPPVRNTWGSSKSAAGKAYFEGAQKRPADESWGGKNGGKGYGAQKWQKGGKAKSAPVCKGHPKCTQAEDCIGNSTAALFQHVDEGVPGDIYCSSCWAVFADADESLNAIPYDE
eukprot:TRINITY_DN108151_c0_g1_i1.p1 TRINITY_DN108151_c0_g1~~TRINITY_DN108151_c0_g1_i1.p1  ORF type:complete len:421 (+),score=113.21 TRINITY_DN108151_c0_g1_i1:159-1265(+)